MNPNSNLTVATENTIDVTHAPQINGWKFESSPEKYCYFFTILRFYEWYIDNFLSTVAVKMVIRDNMIEDLYEICEIPLSHPLSQVGIDDFVRSVMARD